MFLGVFLQDSGQLSALSAHALAELVKATDQFTIRRGEILFRQGMLADALYIIGSGKLEITTRTPGDATAAVSAIGPGEVVGEFALLDDGLRSANVTAMVNSKGLRIPRERFLALLAEGKPWTLELIDTLRCLVASRTRVTLERIAADERYDVSSLRVPAQLRETGMVGDAAGLFAALGRLAELGTEGAAKLTNLGTCLTIPRGTMSTEAASETRALTIVLRGALRSVLPRREGREQIMVHGPGEMTGLVGLFDKSQQSLELEAAEDTVALQLPQAMFDAMRRSPEPYALALFAAVGRQLVRDQRRANRHLGRAVSLEQFNQHCGRNAV